jgi:hypothetical protein
MIGEYDEPLTPRDMDMYDDEGGEEEWGSVY